MKPINTYKKVLLISHNAISMQANNGKTFASLFQDWPPDKFAQLYFQDETPESEKFTNFFMIRDIDILKGILSPFKKNRYGQIIPPSKSPVNLQDIRPTTKSAAINFIKKFESTKLFIRDLLYGTQLWQSPQLFAWLKNFNPDLIFFVGGNSTFSFKIALKISEKLKIPLSTYITDDYIINSTPKGFLSKYLHKKLIETYSESFSKAENTFVIGDLMASVFQERFSRPFIPIMNLPTPPVNVSFEKYKKNTTTITVVYAGGMHLGRLSTLIDFSKILRECQKKSKIPITFEIYSAQKISEKDRLALGECGAIFKGALYGDALEEKLHQADFLLHAESFDNEQIKKTKLSVSTKIPEYLNSGTCLIGFGPSSLASIKIIKDNAIGIVISEADTFDLAVNKISKIITNRKAQEELAISSHRYAKKNFDGVSVRKKFAETINATNIHNHR